MEINDSEKDQRDACFEMNSTKSDRRLQSCYDAKLEMGTPKCRAKTEPKLIMRVCHLLGSTCSFNCKAEFSRMMEEILRQLCNWKA